MIKVRQKPVHEPAPNDNQFNGCPHCNADNSYYYYRQPAELTGTVELNSSDLYYDQDETQEDGRTYYECPECGHELNYDDVVHALQEREQDDD